MTEAGGLNRPWKLAIAAVLLVSIAGRLFALWIAGDRVPLGDPANYETLARNMLSGRGLVIDDPKVMADMRAFYPPGYPILLAAVGLFFPLGAATFAVLNTAIDALASLLIARLGAKLGFERAGIVASLLYFAWPTQMLLAPLAYKEGLVALLVVGQCLSLLGVEKSRWAAAAFGLLTGILALVQPALLLIAPLLGLVIRPRFQTWSGWMQAMAIAAATTILALVPWWIRNWLIFGQFVPLTSSGPSGLWIGAQTSGGWTALPKRLLGGGELASAAQFGSEAKRLILADPAAYVLRSLGKIPEAFQISHHPVGQLYSMDPERHVALLESIAWIPKAATMALLAAALLGFFRALSRDLNCLLLAALAYIPLVAMWFEFSARHRYYLTPLLLLIAATLIDRRDETKRATKD